MDAFNEGDLEDGGSLKVHENPDTEASHADNAKGIDDEVGGTDNITHKGGQDATDDHHSLI